MRINKTIAGISAAVLLATPVVLAQTNGGLLDWRSSRAINTMAEDGLEAAGNLLSMDAMADEASTSAIDFDKLVKYQDKDYVIEHDGTMSTEVLATHKITKLGYGKSTEVRVFRTPTNVYSTDGLFSPNVLYPGIKVTPAPAPMTGIFSLIPGLGWIELKGLADAQSTVFFGGRGANQYISSGGNSCFRGSGFITCT